MAKNDQIDVYGHIPKDIFERGKQVIVKLQVPLAHSGPARALMYDQTRKWDIYLPVTKDLLELMDGSHKSYFLIHFNEKHEIEIDKEIGWQPW